jgi:hypothetical protein
VIPSRSIFGQTRPAVIDEGSIALRACRIHAAAEHVHLAVCATCGAQLTADLEPCCWHPAVGQYVAWRCMWLSDMP